MIRNVHNYFHANYNYHIDFNWFSLVKSILLLS